MIIQYNPCRCVPTPSARANKIHIPEGSTIFISHTRIAPNASSGDISNAKPIIKFSYSSKGSRKFKGREFLLTQEG